MKERFYFMAGIFVASGTAVIMILLFIFSEELSVFNPSKHLFCRFQNVSGLKEGASVSLSGYVIGNVSSVSFQQEGGMLVRLDILDRYISYISDDSVATIGSTGLLGDKALYITKGSSATPVKHGMTLTSKEPFELGSALEDTAGVILQLKLVLTDAQSITQKLSDEYDSLVGSAEALTRIFENIEGGRGNLGMLINDDSLYSNLASSIVRINETADNIAVFSSNLNKTFSGMEGDFEEFKVFMDNLSLSSNNLYIGLKMFPEIMTDLSDIIEAAKFTFQGLQKNPLIGPFIRVTSKTVEHPNFEMLGD